MYVCKYGRLGVGREGGMGGWMEVGRKEGEGREVDWLLDFG